MGHRWPGNIGAAIVLCVGATVAACSGTGTSMPSIGGALPNWFASAKRPAATGTTASAAVKTLDENCPSVDVRTGASTLSIAAKSQQPTAIDLRYQLSFNEMARQCEVDGSTVRMRVGVQGRAIVGPAGAPPQITVPIRYAVVREGVEPKTIVTKFRRIPLQLPPGSTNVVFTDIEEDLSFPMPPLAELQSYVVYVGFDDIGDRGAPRKKKERRPPPRKKNRVSVAPPR
ncbi:MAG: hypothetical protein ACRECO_19730 [Xanthobacteraceae bacterium]